jgi:16S rRNA (guanine527-N7)-methyltransferase
LAESLRAAAAAMAVQLDAAQEAALLRLLDELQLWARAYNLTAIGERAGMITHHLLDSLSVAPYLHGTHIADLGTGAGFPGLPLAIACPERQFTLVDSTAKKVRFIEHAARTLGLRNVRAVHARIEQLPESAPTQAWDTLLARALAPLDKLLPLVRPLCAAQTQVLAMCGRRPDDELAVLAEGWRLLEVQPLRVPGLEAERNLVVLATGHRWVPIDHAGA